MKSTAKKLTLALTLSSTLACTSAFAQLPPATGCYATTSVDYYSLNEVSSSSMPYPGNLVESPTGGYSITTDYRSVTCTDAQGALRGTYPLQNNEQTKTHPVYFSDGSLGLSVREDDTGVSYMLFLNGDCTLRKKVSVDPVAGVPTIASDGTMVLGTNAGSIIFFNSDGTVAKKLDASSDRSFSYFGSPVLQDDDSISMLDTYGALHTVSADRSTVSDYSSSRGNILTPDTSVAWVLRRARPSSWTARET
ncbi:MAG: hypothetical protein HY074_06895 [Deltaproteobacteria bacterium]|nr:hypothetical protein [Deltaproteobacteria bacterium]